MRNPRILASPPPLKVVVDAKTIAESTQRDSSHCMLATAMKKAKPHFTRISVDLQTIRATDSKRGVRHVWFTPRAAQQAIIDFDQGKMPKPFKMTVWGGQTVELVRRNEKQKQAQREYILREKQKKEPRKPSKTLVNHHGTDRVPSVSGGKTPPRGAGRQRTFGLRSLKF